MGVEDGDAGLEGRGDSVFERHDDDGWGERSVEKRKAENKRRNARIESEVGRKTDRQMRSNSVPEVLFFSPRRGRDMLASTPRSEKLTAMKEKQPEFISYLLRHTKQNETRLVSEIGRAHV